jgi:hypothetical protein
MANPEWLQQPFWPRFPKIALIENENLGSKLNYTL